MYTATTYAKIIISEIYIPPSLKTIKPIDMGGLHGGQKFYNGGVLFKVP